LIKIQEFSKINYAAFANDCRVFCLILAHVGRTADRDRARQVQTVQQSKHTPPTPKEFSVT
tara:strand:- start:172 stop:354 length:183 start_codon:yes stop_codon:yes gene_type:complete